MVDRPGPTLRRRKLVKELVAARTAAGLSVRQLASEIDLQGGTISKIESGKQGLTVRNIKAIGRATGLNKAKVDQLLLLAADDDNDDDWLVEFRDDLPDWFALYPELEQDADQIWTYSSELVEGLFQTADYAEAIVRATFPDITEAEVRRIIDVRRARQTLFERESPPRLHLILNEAAVRRPIGGEQVMRQQVLHLIMLAHRWNATVQVLPFEVGAHPGMKSSFTLLRFPEGFDDMDCVYLENENGGVWQEVAEHVARYSEVFDRLGKLALSPNETRSLLTSLA
jgi:transcriptional regulator with XRE-family HTH domain